MSGPPDPPGRTPVPSDPGEEARYQAVSRLDPLQPGGLERLAAELADPSWRVRMAVVERLLSHPDPASVLPVLLPALSSGEGAGTRNAAALALACVGEAAVPALLERLGPGPSEVRSAAAEILGGIRDRGATRALSGLLADADANVRAAAAEALGKIGGSEAAGALLGALDSGDGALRLGALDALERLRIAPPAARLAELSQERALRRPAFRLLGLSDEPEALPILAGGVADPSRSCREAALIAVAQLRARRSPADLAPLAAGLRDAALREPSLPVWSVEAARSEDRRVAEGAVRVLAWLGDPSRAPAIAEAAEDEDLRPAVLEALGDLGPRAGPALAGTLPRLSPGARVTALAALARLGDASVLPDLLSMAAGEDEALRAAAVEALGRLGDLRAVPALAALLDHPDAGASGPAAVALAALASRGEAARAEVLARCRPVPEGRVAAAQLRLLGQVGDGADLPTCHRALRDPRPATRVAAARALEALAARRIGEACPPALLDALDDSVPAVRAAAAEAIGTLGQAARKPGGPGLPDEAARELAATLHDEEPVVRAAAALALGRCGRFEHAGALAELAGAAGAPPEVASAAIRALAELGRADAAVLERAARHPDPEVVKEAVAAAAAASGRAAGELLVDAASHPRWDVRRAAARALAARGDPALAAAARRLLLAEEDPMVAEALADAVRALERRPA